MGEGVFKEDAASRAPDKRALLRRRRSMSEMSPKTHKIFRFSSLVLQHVASNLVLQAQRQQILRVMKNERRRCSYTVNLESLRPTASDAGKQEEDGDNQVRRFKTDSDTFTASTPGSGPSLHRYPS